MSYESPDSQCRTKPTGISVDLSPQLNERLEEISSRHGISKVDMIKRAFALLDVAIATKDSNQRLCVLDQDGRVTKEVIGLL